MEWQKYFIYCDGNLIWRGRPISDFQNDRACKIWNARFAGKLAGTSNGKGYFQVQVQRRRYLVHRIIWELHYGCIDEEIDHIDGNQENNRIENLRKSSRQQNTWNRKANWNAPYKGARFSNAHKKYVAKITINKKVKHLGYFDDPESAFAAYDAAAKVLHGEFYRGGE